MKVKELIKELQKQDQDLEVYIKGKEEKYEKIIDVHHRGIDLGEGTYLMGKDWVVIKI